MTSPEESGHELLVALAGRLPDEVLWRLRDWLAAGAHEPLAAVLTRELLRHRLGLTDAERALLVASAGVWGASRRLLEAVLPLDGPVHSTAVFRSGPGDDGPAALDAAALSVLGVVRGHPGSVELRQAWRSGPAEQRVVVVHGGERRWVLTGTLQRVLRAHGDRTPCVEVLPAHGEPPAYHQAAIIGSAPLWTAARSPAEAVAAGR
ncbi:hypothetical protein [Pseudonocardia broussonetiae]|uniref:Uncharacterized protein n=1 Tax=Pseudonocardia broussonetiae TaxID=2736640 RepID=A0A6M6JHN2_9PSEU|nr:hypothetical protein [Pseudonocardia broussonetiae]QJY45879.1 hypothetical protein HOP40_08750 [Pseudonocardia broussonetiae]